MRQPLIVGRPGAAIPPDQTPDAYAARMGGPATVIQNISLPPDDCAACLICNSQLSLVLQAHVPLDQVEHRFLYIFGCVREGCGVAEGSWRAFRAQIKSPDAIKREPIIEFGQSIQKQSSSDWGLSNDVEDAFDFSELDAALASSDMAVVTACQKQPSTAAASNQDVRLAFENNINLPAFYLWADKEDSGKKGFVSTHRDAVHIDTLIKRYEEELSIVGSVSASLPDVGESCESWEGEGYEDDSVLAPEGRTHADKDFLKFSKRLGRVPDQCARYCFGGEVLWPCSRTDNAACCPLCNGNRIFEVQLMSPAVAALEEAVAWVEEDGGQPEYRPPLSWEWTTIGVWSCENNCGDGWCEEYVEMVNDRYQLPT